MNKILLTLSCLFILLLTAITVSEPITSLTSLPGEHGCASTLHLLTNAFLCSPFHPTTAIVGIFDTFDERTLLVAAGVVDLILFALGLFLLFNRLGWSTRLTSALAASGALFWLNGLDQIYLPGLSLVPLTAFLVGQRGVAPRLFLFLSVCALFLASGAFALANFFVSLVLATTQGKGVQLGRTALICCSGVALLLPTLLLSPSFPEYPIYGQVVLDDGIPGNIYPLVTEAFPTPIINRELIRAVYAPLTLGVGILILILSLSQQMRREPLFRFSAIGLLLVVLDVVFPEELAVIAPLQTLRRVLPDLFFVSMTPYVFVLSVVGTLLALLSLREARFHKLLTFSLMMLVPLLTASPTLSSWKVPAAKECLIRALASPLGSQQRAVLSSPSLPVIRNNDFLVPIHSSSPKRFIPARRTGVQIETSLHPEMIQNMLDRNPKTRWSPMNGQQQGGEYFILLFPSEVTLRGIELNPGEFVSDFPRGVRIELLRHCSKESEVVDHVEFIPWEGRVEITEGGYPFLRIPENGQVQFKKELTGECFRVEQVGKTRLDWSVAKLGFLGDFPLLKTRELKLP